MSKSVSNESDHKGPRKSTLLLLKQVARMYRTVRQSDDKESTVGLN